VHFINKFVWKLDIQTDPEKGDHPFGESGLFEIEHVFENTITKGTCF
jgi:hypothetical protein